MTLSRSSALSISLLSMFDMPGLNEPLFLNTTSFCALSFSFAAEG